MFHALARCCADLMIGGKGSDRSTSAWQQVYRSLEHGLAKSACANSSKMSLFPQAIRNFANLFVALQGKRHSADYDPAARLYKSSVLNDIDIVDNSITQFNSAPIKDRRAFAAHVLFKQRV
jgi:hypothetical protein